MLSGGHYTGVVYCYILSDGHYTGVVYCINYCIYYM